MSVTVLEQSPMERDWTERTFFSAEPDWLKEAMRCDAISPVEGTNPQEWNVGHYADGRKVAKPDAIIVRDAHTGKIHVGEAA